MRDDAAKHTDDLGWLVARRNRVQNLLLSLYRSLAPSASSNQDAVLLLCGVAFSLWRAVFLVKSPRSDDDMLSDARHFMELLVQDNAINYTQDKKTRSWTAGYYLNNAYFRLSLGYEKLQLPSAREWQYRHVVDAWMDEQRGTLAPEDLFLAWDNACDACCELASAATGESFDEICKAVSA